MTERLVEMLRDKAKTYDLSALAARDAGDSMSALAFTTIAVAMGELAEMFEHELEEAA